MPMTGDLEKNLNPRTNNFTPRDRSRRMGCMISRAGRKTNIMQDGPSEEIERGGEQTQGRHHFCLFTIVTGLSQGILNKIYVCSLVLYGIIL